MPIRDRCRHELDRLVKRLLHCLEVVCLSNFDADIRGIHATEHRFHSLRSGKLLMWILFHHEEILLEFGNILLIREELFILVMDFQDLALSTLDALVELTIPVIVPNQYKPCLVPVIYSLVAVLDPRPYWHHIYTGRLQHLEDNFVVVLKVLALQGHLVASLLVVLEEQLTMLVHVMTYRMVVNRNVGSAQGHIQFVNELNLPVFQPCWSVWYLPDLMMSTSILP